MYGFILPRIGALQTRGGVFRGEGLYSHPTPDFFWKNSLQLSNIHSITFPHPLKKRRLKREKIG